MFFLVACAVMFLMGLFAVIKGKVQISSRKEVIGLPARLLGVALMCSPPAAMGISLAGTVLVMVATNRSVEQASENLALALLPMGSMFGLGFVSFLVASKFARPIHSGKHAPPEGFQFTPPGEVREKFVPPSEDSK